MKAYPLPLAHRIIGALALLLLGVPSARAADRIVPFVYATIQAGVDAAAEGDRVLVFDGTYTGPGNHDVDLGSKNVTIESQSGNPTTCIIDCQQAGRAFRIAGGQTGATRISGLTIKNGSPGPGNDEAGEGGAVLIRGAQPALTNCVFTSNYAPLGGAIYIGSNGSALLADCQFTDNHSGIGGAVMVLEASLNALRCTFSGNRADDEGGAIYGIVLRGLDIENCAFTRNTAMSGGAILLNVAQVGVNPYIANCTFSANSAGDYGGGIGLDNGAIGDVTNCTFSGNTAGEGGGAVASIGELTLRNCILWGDSAPDNAEIQYFPGTIFFMEVSQCDVQGGLPPGVTDGGGNTDSPPQFVRFPRTNGPDDPGDLRLRHDSPCVDAGDNTLLPPDRSDLDGDGDRGERLPLDLAGNPRLVGGTVDLGAFETPGTPGVDIRLTVALTRDSGTGEIIATITLRNRGQSPASGVQITEARLGSWQTGTALPTPPTTLDGVIISVQTFRFPSVPAGQRTMLKIAGQHLSGTFGGSIRLPLPL
jgi:predicted outer membrane repeat protein